MYKRNIISLYAFASLFYKFQIKYVSWETIMSCSDKKCINKLVLVN